MNWQSWLKGLFAAAIGGASSGVITAFTSMGIDPDHFNFKGGIRALFTLAGVVALVNAVLSAAFYLKQSPVPNGSPPSPPQFKSMIGGPK